MSISFSSAVGNLVNRLGKLGLLAKNVKSFQSTLLTSMTDTSNGIVAQYNGESDIQALMGSAYVNVLSGLEGAPQLAQQLAKQTINRMVFRDNPQISQTLQKLNLDASITEVIRQMKVAGASVLQQSVSGTPGTFTGTGNGVVNVSVKRPFDGVLLENILAENVLFTCISDSYTGGSTSGNEGFSITGTGAQSDIFAFNWPLGSGATGSYSAIDGDADNSSGNLLTNSGFTNFTANVPDDWTLTVGTAGTHVLKNAGIVYSSGNSLQMVGDGSTLTSLQQQFDSATGTSGSLTFLTQYGTCLFLRRDGVAPAAGVLTIDLVDVNGVVLKDQAGVNNSFTIDLTTLTTSFQKFTGVFRTPAVMPTTLNYRIRQTTALTNNRSVYLDKVSLGQMNQLYTHGPFFSIHAGSLPFQDGDYSFCALSNPRGGGGVLDTFQTLLYRLFYPDSQNLEVLYPSSSTPTIADALIG